VNTIAAVTVAVKSAVQVKTFATNESYVLDVSSPRIQITAETVYGARSTL
jgi:ribosome maturation factor RimP